MRRWVGGAGATVLGVVLLVAVAAKVLHPAAFASRIAAEGLAGWIPPMAMAVSALGLEAGVGTALLLGIRHPALLAVTTLMVALFLFLTGRTYVLVLSGAAPPDDGCGCFGTLLERTPGEAFWGDLGLLLLPLAMVLWASRPFPWQLPGRRLAATGAVALAVMALAAKAPSLPVDDYATQLRPGVALSELCAGKDPRVCLDEAVSDLTEGKHWVVVSDLGEGLEARVDALNQALWGNGRAWGLHVLTAKPAREVDRLRFGRGPAFAIHGDLPEAVLSRLYRTLPRSFLVVDGRVVETASGWPPWLESDP